MYKTCAFEAQRGKRALVPYAIRKCPDQPANLRTLTRAFDIFYSTIGSAYKGPDHTAHVHGPSLFAYPIRTQAAHIHYENTPVQIYREFHLQKLKIFR